MKKIIIFSFISFIAMSLFSQTRSRKDLIEARNTFILQKTAIDSIVQSHSNVDGSDVSSLMTTKAIVDYVNQQIAATGGGSNSDTRLEFKRSFIDTMVFNKIDVLTNSVIDSIFCPIIVSANSTGSGVWGVETFINQTGSAITISGTLPTVNQSQRIKVVVGIELTFNEDYTISGNTITFTIPLDGDNVKVWFY